MKKIFNSLMMAALLLTANATRSHAQALNFGAYSYITIGDIMDDNQSYTKEAWIRVYNYQASHGCNILSSWDSPFWLENGILSAANGYGTNSVATVSDPASFPIGQWVHVAVTYSASTSTMKLYKNGALIATSANAPSFIATDLQIGAQEYGDFFDGGDIDEVRLWDVALTQSQIQANMNCDVPKQANLAAYYRFNQGTPGADNTTLSSVYDYSGNANCGFMVGFNLTGNTSNYIAGAIGSCSNITPVLAAPAAITGSSAVCTDASITLANTIDGGLWQVDDLDTADITTDGLLTGHYAGTVTVSYKTCGGSVTKTVTVNPSPSVQGTAGIGSITTVVTGGTSPYTYLWSNHATTANLSNLNTGTYTVTVTDAKGCTATDADYVTSAIVLTNVITITPANKTFTGGVSNNIYLGYGPQSATLTSSPTGANSFTYSWSPSTYLSNTNTANPTFTPTAAGHYTYTCTATSNGHSVSASVTMCVVDAVDHNHNGKVLVCHVSKCKHGHSNTKSIKSNAVAKHLAKYSSDHLGACYAGCNAGAKSTNGNVTGKQTKVFWDKLAINASPNPFNNDINVKVEGNESGFADITIYDLAGRVLEYKQHQNTDATIQMGHNLANGIYVLEVSNGTTSNKVKVVKMN